MPWTNPTRCELTMEHNGETATVAFDEAKISPLWVKRTQEKDLEAVSRALSEVILEWGPLEDGSFRAPTFDELLAVPFAAQVKLARRMIEDTGLASEEGNELSPPSANTANQAEGFEQESPVSPNGSDSSPATVPSPSVSTAPTST